MKQALLVLAFTTTAAASEPFHWGVNGHPTAQEGYRQVPIATQLDLVAGEEGSLVPAQEDRPALAELLSAQDRSGHRLSDDSLPLRGGFVLQGDRVDIDLSLDAQLVELKADILPELAAKTFPPGEENPE